jgi:hypothetical protein
VNVLVRGPIRDEELHILVFNLARSWPDIFKTHVGGTHGHFTVMSKKKKYILNLTLVFTCSSAESR